MTEILIPKTPKKKSPYNPDAPKDCADFVPLDDGTIAGDKKYCNLSFECKQMEMYSEFVKFLNEQGVIVLQDYMCTGKYAIWEERSKDEEAT